MSDIQEQNSPSSRWGTFSSNLVCYQCGWSYLVSPSHTLKRCPHCFSPQIGLSTNPPESTGDEYVPEMLAPPTLNPQSLLVSAQSFTRGIPFSPSDLTASNLERRKQLVFLPVWLVDCSVQSTWDAEAGTIYKVLSHQDSYNDLSRQWQSKKVSEQRTKWEKRVGNLTRSYMNIPAPAIEDDTSIKNKVGEPPRSGYVSFSPEQLGNGIVRLPNRSTRDAWTQAYINLTSQASTEVQKACSADFIRNFSWEPNVTNQNWTLLLYPIFTSYYLDDNNIPQPVIIHGNTGKIFGKRRASMKKAKTAAIITFSIAAAFFLLSLLSAAGSMVMPLLSPVAIILFLTAVIAAIGAFIVLGIAWQFNRSQT